MRPCPAAERLTRLQHGGHEPRYFRHDRHRAAQSWAKSSRPLLPFRRQRAGQFPLARLTEHAAQLPDALGVIGQPHAVARPSRARIQFAGWWWTAVAQSSSRPILFSLAPHCLACRVLHLEPVRRSTGAVSRVLPLGHDAFEPELTGMTKEPNDLLFSQHGHDATAILPPFCPRPVIEKA